MFFNVISVIKCPSYASLRCITALLHQRLARIVFIIEKESINNDLEFWMNLRPKSIHYCRVVYKVLSITRLKYSRHKIINPFPRYCPVVFYATFEALFSKLKLLRNIFFSCLRSLQNCFIAQSCIRLPRLRDGVTWTTSRAWNEQVSL